MNSIYFQASKAARKSVRTTRLKSKLVQEEIAKNNVALGKSRRNIFKKNLPSRTPMTSSNTLSTAQSLFHAGAYYQVGDIVSLMDDRDDVFYAQIRGLIQDSFCEKSAVITWLLPTTVSPDPKERFDAATYTIGPEEDQPRRLGTMEFVMHAPSNYYHDKTNPYPAAEVLQKDNHLSNYCGFIWTNLAKREVQQGRGSHNQF